MRKNVLFFLFLLSALTLYGQELQRKLLTESDGFKWYRLEQGKTMGAEDSFGNVLIPLSKGFTYVQVYHGRFLVNDGIRKQGIYDLKGNELFSPDKGYAFNSVIDLDDRSIFGTYKYYLKSKNEKQGLCDLSGNDIIPCIYDFIYYKSENDKRYFKVENNGKYGAYNIVGKEILPCKYNSLYYDYDDDCFKHKVGNEFVSLNVRLKNTSDLIIKEPSKPSESYAISPQRSSTSKDSNYGHNSKHGKIINKASEQQGSVVVKKEWYEDGYYSVLLMDKCKVCGGTGRVGYNFCTAGCAMGLLTLITYYDPNGNEVERGGTMGTPNNSYYGGSSGGSYSGSSSGSSGSSSVYTKCTSCNGTGRCTSCNGRGYKFNSYSGHDDSCPSCRGKGSCPICYGRGKL